jgi:glutamyl-tRNA synthetase
MYRFAPSSIDELSLNGLRVALYNYIFAKQSGGMFIVRIEDSQKDKDIKDKSILEILEIFGITYDNLYYQSENTKYYLQFASYLMDKKEAFACFCNDEELKDEKYSGKCLHVSEEELLNNNLPFTIRIKKPEHSITFQDSIKGKMTYEKDDVDSFIIMTRKKYPTYNFACAIDDMIQGVKYIIREDKHISNTPKQEHIRRVLGYDEEIKYAHLPSIVEINWSVKKLLDMGYMPEAIINYLILIGFETPKEIFSLNEAIGWLEIEKISKKSIKFDIEKLKFINSKHIQLIEDVELSKRLGYSCASIGKLAKLYTKSCHNTLEIKEKIDTIFAPKNSDKYKKELELLKSIVKEASYFDDFDGFKKYMEEKSGLKDGKILKILLTGSENCPNLEELYPLIKNYLTEIAK